MYVFSSVKGLFDTLSPEGVTIHRLRITALEAAELWVSGPHGFWRKKAGVWASKANVLEWK